MILKKHIDLIAIMLCIIAFVIFCSQVQYERKRILAEYDYGYDANVRSMYSIMSYVYEYGLLYTVSEDKKADILERTDNALKSGRISEYEYECYMKIYNGGFSVDEYFDEGGNLAGLRHIFFYEGAQYLWKETDSNFMNVYPYWEDGMIYFDAEERNNIFDSITFSF